MYKLPLHELPWRDEAKGRRVYDALARYFIKMHPNSGLNPDYLFVGDVVEYFEGAAQIGIPLHIPGLGMRPYGILRKVFNRSGIVLPDCEVTSRNRVRYLIFPK